MKERTLTTISIINQKGGVGKSTTAWALGEGLKSKGYKVLFVDMDAQGNLTYSMSEPISDKNSFEVLKNSASIKENIVQTEQGDLIASTPALASADIAFTETGKEFQLQRALRHVNNDYDFCIIDTPPALGILTINALTASDGALIPAQADIYSLQGIGQLNKTVEAVREYTNDKLKVFGIVLTRFNKRSIIRREVAQALEGMAQQLSTKLFNTRIRECTALVEAQAVQKSIYQYAPRSNAAADYMELTKEFLKTIKQG